MFFRINLVILYFFLIVMGQKIYADGVINGSFEQGDLNGWSLQGSLYGDDGNGEAQIVDNWRFYDSFSNLHATEGNLFVVIRATAYDHGAMAPTEYDYGISQTFSTSTASTLYFDYAGPGSASGMPWVGGSIGGSIILLDSQLISTDTSSDDNWTNFAYSILPGSHKLEINIAAVAQAAPLGPIASDIEYIAIDNVRLVPIPEPSTIVLLSVSAIGFLACAWRRRKLETSGIGRRN